MATLAEIAAVYRSFWPPGDERIYAFDDAQDIIGDAFQAQCQAVKNASDLVDLLRLETNILSMLAKIPDWEIATGLQATRTAAIGNAQSRRNAIIGQLRRTGAVDVPSIQAIMAAFLNYAPGVMPPVIEMDRAVLTAALQRPITGGAITAGATTDFPVTLADNAPVSNAGALVGFRLSHATPADLTVQLVTPLGAVLPLPVALGTAALVTVNFQTRTNVAASTPVSGIWKLRFVDSGASGGALATNAATFLHAEGIGRNAWGAEGLGSGIFEWAVLVDPALIPGSAVVDYTAIRALLNQIKPAHTIVFLDLKTTVGGACGVWDVSAWDSFLWC